MATAGELLAQASGLSGVSAGAMLVSLGGGGASAADLFVSFFGPGVPGEMLLAGGIAAPPAPTLSSGRRDMRQKRRAEMARQTRRRHEAEFFLVAMP